MLKFKWKKTLGYTYHRVRVSLWRLYTEIHVIFLIHHDFYYMFTNLQVISCCCFFFLLRSHSFYFVLTGFLPMIRIAFVSVQETWLWIQYMVKEFQSISFYLKLLAYSTELELTALINYTSHATNIFAQIKSDFNFSIWVMKIVFLRICHDDYWLGDSR